MSVFTDSDISQMLEYLFGSFVLGYVVGIFIVAFKKAIDLI